MGSEWHGVFTFNVFTFSVFTFNNNNNNNNVCKNLPRSNPDPAIYFSSHNFVICEMGVFMITVTYTVR